MKLFDLNTVNCPPLGTDTLVITPNNRIARKFLKSYADDQIAAGKKAWPSLSVLPMRAWIYESAKLLQSRGYTPLQAVQILNPCQALTIFKRIVHADLNKPELQEESLDLIGNEHQMAKTALQAWEHLHFWDIGLDDHELSLTMESERFQRWAQDFNTTCLQNQWITQSQLPHIVCQAIKDGVLSVKKKVVLYAFDDITPVHQRIFDSFEAHPHVHLTQLTSFIAHESLKRVALYDTEEEIRTCARWSKQILEDQPDALIGVVVPELTRHRHELLRHFSDIFEPQHILPETVRYTPPFNISAGVAFNRIPIIEMAFRCLNLDRGMVSASDLTDILLTPFIAGGESERSQRSMADVMFKAKRQKRYVVSDVIQSLNRCPILKEKLLDFQGVLYGKDLQLPSQWAYVFNQQLQAIGWPGQRNLDSEEYQAVAQWTALLDKLAHMDTVANAVSIRQALDFLKVLAVETIFQPETKESPIQILGSLEAAGLQFTHLWVMGLSDDVWPTVAKPNRFLPVPLQRNPGQTQYGLPKPPMPHASADRELQYARNLTQRFLKSAYHLVFSHPVNDGERELRMSPLISFIPPTNAVNLKLDSDTRYSDLLHDVIPLIAQDDQFSPALPKGSVMKGGSSALKDYAACPFRAFARHQLNIKPAEEVRNGLDDRDRGNVLHAIMDKLWTCLKNHQSLIAMDNDSLQSFIETHIDTVLEQYSEQLPALNGGRFHSIEKQRLSAIVLEHLNNEKLRVPFKVLHTEMPLSYEHDGITINLKLDRVDTVQGESVLTDYKTGKVSMGSWTGDRPNEPQIPLYTSAYTDKTHGVMFSQLKAGNVQTVGLADVEVAEGVIIPAKARQPLPGHWDELLKQWKRVTDDLISDYSSGDTAVDPKLGAQTCQYCDYPSLCRI